MNEPAMGVSADSRPLFVTGTDTGVGKTSVVRGLLRQLTRAGLRPFPVKLIETGCETKGTPSAESDAGAIADAAERIPDLPLIGPFRFRTPASPRTAARIEGREIRFSQLVAALQKVQELSRLVILEGAGGLMVPIGPDGCFADFAAEINARLLVVARDALGTLNHTLLTLDAAKHRGLEVVAVVLNATSGTPSAIDHRYELEDLHINAPVFGPMRWLPGATNDQLADELERISLGAGEILRIGFPGRHST